MDTRESEGAQPSDNTRVVREARGLFAWILRFKTFEALRHPDYQLLWTSHVFSSMATWMDQVTRGWLIYELTNSSFQLGMVRGVQALPILLLSPIAGSTADRYSRKAQIMIAQVVDAILYGLLAILIFAGNIVPWHVYLTAVVMACVQTFQQPSRAALVSDAVPKESLTNAIGLNAMMFNVARITGPAIAGLIIAGWNTGGAYAVQAIFYVLAIIWTIKLRAEERAAAAGHGHSGHDEGFLRSIVEGWQYSWRNIEVRTGLLVTAFASLFIIPFNTLLPVFARDLLNVGAKGQGLLLTAMGIGALASSVLIATLGDRLPRGMVMLCGVGLYGLLVVGFAVCPWFSVALVLMALVGLCHVASHALVQTVIQTYSPREMRGRTTALFHMMQVILMIGGLIIGAFASWVGAQWAVALMSVAGTLSMLGIYLAIPRARYIR
ncbi:MAG: MFS transporter [Deltaproteobacteria bacterium]|nr:MFS transporter [Deltaproteobacteria bacterium]